MPLRLAAVLLVLACGLACGLACRTVVPRAGGGDPAADTRAIEALLTDWHLAASRADGASYFGAMAEDAVYLGTDASERWDLPAFRAFCEPYFAKGVGWTYAARARHVQLLGDVAWFDEELWNDKYGVCRGTGVLRREGGTWRIVHYSLTLPVPNEMAEEVVRMIRGG